MPITSVTILKKIAKSFTRLNLKIMRQYRAQGDLLENLYNIFTVCSEPPWTNIISPKQFCGTDFF